DRIALMTLNSLEGAEISSGARRAGLVIVPVNYRLTGAEIAYVLNDSGAKVAIAGPEFVEAMAAAQPEMSREVRFVAIGDHVPPGWLSYRRVMDDAADVFDAIGDGLGASMIYTSGTTGRPKGAWRPNGVNVGHLLGLISLFELDSQDVHLVSGR